MRRPYRHQNVYFFTPVWMVGDMVHEHSRPLQTWLLQRDRAHSSFHTLPKQRRGCCLTQRLTMNPILLRPFYYLNHLLEWLLLYFFLLFFFWNSPITPRNLSILPPCSWLAHVFLSLSSSLRVVTSTGHQRNMVPESGTDLSLRSPCDRSGCLQK